MDHDALDGEVVSDRQVGVFSGSDTVGAPGLVLPPGWRLDELCLAVLVGYRDFQPSGLDGAPPTALQPAVELPVAYGRDRLLGYEGNDYPGSDLGKRLKVEGDGEPFLDEVFGHDGEPRVVAVIGRRHDLVGGVGVAHAEFVIAVGQEGVVQDEVPFAAILQYGGWVRVVEESGFPLASVAEVPAAFFGKALALEGRPVLAVVQFVPAIVKLFLCQDWAFEAACS